MMGFLKDFFRGAILVVFFISTLCLSVYGERVFVSPDESAAFFFAEQLADTGALSAHESLNTTLNGLIHPRSVAVMGELLVPGSFIGLPIVAGLMMMPFGDAGGLLLTPILALFGVLAFRASIKILFEDEGLADLSAFLLMAHPAYLYFSGRVMMHNVAFVDFLIFAVYFAVARPFGSKSIFVKELHRLEYLFSGIMVGLAIFFRISEALWILPVAFGLLLVFRNNLGWRSLVSFMAGLGLMAVVIFGANSWVYGSPFVTGYTIPAPIVESVSDQENIKSNQLASPSTSQLPFGFHPRAVLRNVWNYGILLYPWMTIVSIFGFVLLAVRKFEKNKVWKTLTVISILVAGALFIFYGSWNFIDNPDPSLVTIGNSHVRYWLPVFILSIPFASYLILSVWRYFALLPLPEVEGVGVRVRVEIGMVRTLARIFLALALLVGLITNVRLVFYGHDGILASRAAMSTFIGKRARIMTLTPPESVIIVDRADKYLFPYRRVVVPLRDDKTYAALVELVKDVPTYYFGITFPQTDLDYLNGDKLKAMGLKIELVETISEESLYKFSHAPIKIN